MTRTPLYRARPNGFDIKPAGQPEATRINDFIHLSPGLSNSYLVTTPEGRIVVNTGMGFEAPVHKRNFDAVDQSAVRYILLTQGHVDHVGGVDLFRAEGTQVIAHANIAEGSPAACGDRHREPARFSKGLLGTLAVACSLASHRAIDSRNLVAFESLEAR